MEAQCKWFCNFEDVKHHRPDSVLWYQQGYEGGPLIFPAGYTPYWSLQQDWYDGVPGPGDAASSGY